MQPLRLRVAAAAAPRLALRRYFSSAAAPPRICIVGAGPSGFYTAKYVLQKNEEATVSIVERLPTPYGLVRFGVAPDHQPTKSVMSDFSTTLDNPRCSFHGNIEVGVDVSIPKLMSAYDAVVLAYGASGDRALGVPGEELAGVRSAREFVNWYNGHPDFASADFDELLKTTTKCVVIGQGNVAIDVSRILLSPLSHLKTSDICEHALRALETSPIESVSVLGRRGPVQSAFTIKELRELTKLDGVACRISQEEVEKGMNQASMDEISASRPAKRKFDLLKKVADSEPEPNDKDLNIRFFLSPTRILEAEGGGGRVGAVECDVTALEGEANSQRAEKTGETVKIECDLLLSSVGYQSHPLPEIPFDSKRNVVPSENGRVVSEDGNCIQGLYVSGWLKRGPTGIIGTNIPDAKETAAAILEDLSEGKLSSDASETNDPFEVLYQKKSVDIEGWRRIETVEDDLGQKNGKPREKIVKWDKLLEIAKD